MVTRPFERNMDKKTDIFRISLLSLSAYYSFSISPHIRTFVYFYSLSVSFIPFKVYSSFLLPLQTWSHYRVSSILHYFIFGNISPFFSDLSTFHTCNVMQLMRMSSLLLGTKSDPVLESSLFTSEWFRWRAKRMDKKDRNQSWGLREEDVCNHHHHLSQNDDGLDYKTSSSAAGIVRMYEWRVN